MTDQTRITALLEPVANVCYCVAAARRQQASVPVHSQKQAGKVPGDDASIMLLAAMLIGLFLLGMLLGPIAMGVGLVVGTVASLMWTVRTVHHVRSRDYRFSGQASDRVHVASVAKAKGRSMKHSRTASTR